MANARGRRGKKCVRVRLIDEAGRKRKKKAVAVKIERAGDTWPDTYMTPCVPKTRVSFVVRPKREGERTRKKEKRGRERETYVCLYVCSCARKTGKYGGSAKLARIARDGLRRSVR